jgi:hypothetical protein
MKARHLLFATWLIAASGCIERSGSASESDAPEMDASTVSGNSPMGDSGVQNVSDGGSTTSDAATNSPATDAMTPVGRDAGGNVPTDVPPPPAEDSPCDRFCARMNMCLFPACSGLEDLVPEDFCRDWCGAPDSENWLDESADLSCAEYNERIYEKAEELREFCSDEPAPDECQAICEFAAECGFPGDGCTRLCRSLGQNQRDCLRRSETCNELFGCIEGDEPQRPEPAELCEPYCSRRSTCIFNGCSPGTLPPGYTRSCMASCEEDPLGFREFQAFFDQSCQEIITSAREADAMLDARCDAEDAAACANVCADRVVPCMGITQEACVAECETWDEANQICVATARSCEDVSECFGDPEGQALCRRSCDRLQDCLEEACPPRIIPPSLTDGCTAGCLDDPPSEREIEQWEAMSCREVRETVYRDNRQLRPLCEGNGDFRPLPDECVAFCDQTLLQCIGIGGRNFCTAACSTLTREEYQCALEAQGDCAAINTCLGD